MVVEVRRCTVRLLTLTLQLCRKWQWVVSSDSRTNLS